MEMNYKKLIVYGGGVSGLIGFGVFAYKFVKEFKRQNQELKAEVEDIQKEYSELLEQYTYLSDRYEQEVRYLHHDIDTKDLVIENQAEMIKAMNGDIVVDDEGDVEFVENPEIKEMREQRQPKQQITKAVKKPIVENAFELYPTETDEPVMSSPLETVGDPDLTDEFYAGDAAYQQYITELLVDLNEQEEFVDTANARFELFEMGVDNEDNWIQERIRVLSREYLGENIQEFVPVEDIKRLRMKHGFNYEKEVSMGELIMYYADRWYNDLDNVSRLSFVNHVLWVTDLYDEELSANDLNNIITLIIDGDGVFESGFGLFGTSNDNIRHLDIQYRDFLQEVLDSEVLEEE